MSATPPVHAAPRPLLDLLARAVLAVLDPIDPAPVRPAPGRVTPRYAAFDAPTYQRRGLRIAGLEDDPGASAPIAPARTIVTRASSRACSTDSPPRSPT